MSTLQTLQFATRNDLEASTREALVPLLNARLADSVDLQLQAKQAHWNVKGPQFIALHQLFDDLYEQAGEWVDLIAERAVQLGGLAEGTLDLVAARTELPTYPLETDGGRDHVVAISASLAAFGARIRSAISAAENEGDAGTADLFTEIVRAADKMLWFVESHLQTDQ
jgi:starvation-inducible DNA-binding protein